MLGHVGVYQYLEEQAALQKGLDPKELLLTIFIRCYFVVRLKLLNLNDIFQLSSSFLDNYLKEKTNNVGSCLWLL